MGFDDFARVWENGGFGIYDFFYYFFLIAKIGFFVCLFSQENFWVMGLLEIGLFVGEDHKVHVVGKEEHEFSYVKNNEK